MAKCNARKFVVFILLIAISVGMCSCRHTQPIPEEGVWYCEELLIEINFSLLQQQKNTQFCTKRYNPDGTYHYLDLLLMDYEGHIWIRSLDYSEEYLLGKFVYRQDTFTVTTIDGDHTYIFERIDN